MQLARRHAAEWNVKPDGIGLMGFSAGGHLAAMVGMTASTAVRPNFLVLVYPALPRELQVPAELHVYSGGGHGFGMKKSGKTSEHWPQALAAWLAQ